MCKQCVTREKQFCNLGPCKDLIISYNKMNDALDPFTAEITNTIHLQNGLSYRSVLYAFKKLF